MHEALDLRGNLGAAGLALLALAFDLGKLFFIVCHEYLRESLFVQAHARIRYCKP